MSDTLFAEALAHYQAGRHADAVSRCHLILVSDPDHVDSLHLLGLARIDGGTPASAVPLIRRAMQLSARNAAHHNSLGLALSRLGRLDEALREFLVAADLRPGSAEIQNNLATLFHDAGQQAQAIAHYREALRYAPSLADVWYNLANVLTDAEIAAEAEACFRQAVALRPDFAAAFANLGRFLARQCRWDEAEALLRRTLDLAPHDAASWTNLGMVAHECGRAAQAETYYRRALALDPSVAGVHYNLGCLLSGQGRTDEALASHRAALAADPGFAAARLAGCMAHLPVLYRSEQEVAERRRDYSEALHALSMATDLHDLAPAIGSAQPFFLPYQGEDDRALQSAYGRLACRTLAAARPAAALATWRGERVRLGIVSGFFCDHTVFKLFLEGWLARLDRDRFEVIGFHTSGTRDRWTEWCASRCDSFVQGLLSPAAWRDAIEAAAPHVLLYPEIGMDPVAGHLAALRLAPLQAAAWGQPETTGLPTIDCFLSSELMEPEGAEALYTERLVRLPNLGICVEPGLPEAPRLDRRALGLDPTGPVFWSGQALYKYLPRYDAIYPRIAAQLGMCQFVFIAFAKSRAVTDAFRERLGAAFAAAGLDPARHIVVLPPLSQRDYIDAVRLADVVLDTPGWSGGKSTLDCLAVDPAVITLPGRFMRGRHTAAILRRIGCEETVAQSEDGYVDLAVRLGRDEAWRAALRRKVARQKHRAFRDVDAVRALETCLLDGLAERCGSAHQRSASG